MKLALLSILFAFNVFAVDTDRYRPHCDKPHTMQEWVLSTGEFKTCVYYKAKDGKWKYEWLGEAEYEEWLKGPDKDYYTTRWWSNYANPPAITGSPIWITPTELTLYKLTDEEVTLFKSATAIQQALNEFALYMNQSSSPYQIGELLDIVYQMVVKKVEDRVGVKHLHFTSDFAYASESLFNEK